ncbi:ABC transporter substrate-binding protein [Kineothrix sp. MB12-C1]|uniref:ABC transporter substrate-binding protein n=1 Tax=Kineothrix sp. MB12-C1 TaxID=3070215 RepID=UPI0027D2DD1A|nr:ABC transporter substrate-binding protein [Kineothrix sp. MB12-C1]WMC92522.1 ABC transporter substrate-binding protein [Kineothrix sp. MB12-C1]
MENYFKLTDTIYDITEKYPEMIALLAANGFEPLKNDAMRKTMGKTISLETALRSKKINVELFVKKMEDAIEQSQYSVSTGLTDMKKDTGADIRIEGVLPCPIRIPLLEKFESWFNEKKDSFGYEVDYNLQAASMGLDHIKERVLASGGNPDGLSDLYLSAGFDLFFDQKLMGQYRDIGVFEEISGVEHLNSDFENESLNMKDPRGQYAIIGVVPAIFMVNTAVLGDRPFPESWTDLFRPEFENSISLPTRDLDMFNALLLHIHRYYGEEGVTKLGRAMLRSMHPAQMVKSHIKKGEDVVPAVTITPYFFTHMIDAKSPLVPVWPKDGAVVSPIFLLAKSKSKDKAKPFVDFLFSKEVGEVFTSNGKFPSTNPLVDNRLQPEQNFMWLGWDYIYENDISQLIETTEQLFFEAYGKEQL